MGEDQVLGRVQREQFRRLPALPVVRQARGALPGLDSKLVFLGAPTVRDGAGRDLRAVESQHWSVGLVSARGWRTQRKVHERPETTQLPLYHFRAVPGEILQRSVQRGHREVL